MDRYKRIPQIATALGVGVSAAFGVWAVEWLKPFHLPGLFVLLFTLASIGFGSWLITVAFDHLFERSKLLRRFLLGTQYVEGTWFLEISSNDELIGFAVSRIEAEGSSLRWSGQHYDSDGQIKGSVKGKVLEICWPKIRYIYESDRDDPTNLHREGYGERSFVEHDGPPISFNGFFVDHLSGEKRRTKAWKVENKEEVAKLKDTSRCDAYIKEHKVKRLKNTDLSSA